MALTDEDLLLERSHPGLVGGVQRIYHFGNGKGLSVVNSPMLHSYPFAWEAAVINGIEKLDEGFKYDKIDYTTELTNDVEVFTTDEEANAFIAKAKEVLS